MKYPQIIILLALSMLMVSCSGEKQNESKITTRKATPMQDPVRFCERMTSDYFDGLMNSTNEFTHINITYSNFTEKDIENSPQNHLMIISESREFIPLEKKTALQKLVLSDMENCKAIYSRLSPPSHDSYKCEFPPDTIKSIFEIIQKQGDYFFNGEEFKGKDSVEIEYANEFGHENFFALNIQKETPMENNRRKYLTICKGWYPGSDPPDELKSLIEYIEGTIFPAMLLCKEE